MDWGSVCSYVNAKGVCCGEERAVTYGHELWVVTERMRLQIQEAEISFLHRLTQLSLRNRVRSLDIRERLRVELLLLPGERS